MLFKLLCTVYQCTLFQMQCSASEMTRDFKPSKQPPSFQCVTPIHDSINCHRIKLPPALHLFSHWLSFCTRKYIMLQTYNGLYWSKHTEISIRTSNSHVSWSMRSCETNLRWLLSNKPSEISPKLLWEKLKTNLKQNRQRPGVGVMRKPGFYEAWVHAESKPITCMTEDLNWAEDKGGKAYVWNVGSHAPIAHQLSELISISLCAWNKTRHIQKFLWKREAAWFSFKIFFGRNRNKAWANMNCHNNASMIYYFSESERSFIYMMSTRMAEWYGTIMLVWKLKLVFLKWLWHVFYMQITGLYSVHERMQAMAVLSEHILHVPKGLSQQPSVMRSWLYDRHALSIICPQALIWLLLGHLKYNHMFT